MPRIDHDAFGAVDEEEVLRSLAAIAALLFITTGGELLHVCGTDTTNHSVKEEKRLIPFALSRNLLEVVDKATGGAATFSFSTRADKNKHDYTTTLRGHTTKETSQRTITDSGTVSHPQLPLGREVIRQVALTGTVKLVRVDLTFVKGEYGGVPPTEFVLTEIVMGGAAQRTTTSAPLIRVGINRGVPPSEQQPLLL
ncbi:Hypothetical protein, putative [Bodo saltans]|uniref:Uncharacterized protein n=1 Tax=Bodo saltans TaxID=75058 RepID=A0A0S4J1R0_BODSA|nr:Hypothetical protein, putative [Bodo saltans]|eukprot:CUG83052.1 Hypothetical protein, putative [Bodo saltans]